MNTLTDMYEKVLEGRVYGCASSVALTALCLAIVCMVVIAAAEYSSHGKVVSNRLLNSLAVVAVLAFVATAYTGMQRAARPTMADLEAVFPYQVGQEIVNSPKFQEIVDRAINLLPEGERKDNNK